MSPGPSYLPSPPFLGLPPRRQGCQADQALRRPLFTSQADTRGAGISPHILQVRELGEAPAGRGRACEGHFCRQVWGRELQGGRGSPRSSPPCSCHRRGPDTGRCCCLAGCPGPPSGLPRLHPGLTLWPCPQPPAPSREDTEPHGRTAAVASRLCFALHGSPRREVLSSPFYR